MEIAVTILFGFVIICTILLFNLSHYFRESGKDTVEILELLTKKMLAQEEELLILKKNQETQTKMIQSLQSDLFRLPKGN